MSEWFKLDVPEVLERLKTDVDRGLSGDEAARRLGEYGSNELVERGVESPWLIFLDQFRETMVIILIFAAVVSAFLGEYTDAIVIFIIVILNALLGFRQEYQAEQAMAALKKLAVPTVRVRREGHVLEISSRELVPGDIVLLEAGNLVPADCRLVESVNMRVQEAALTGESEPVEKDAGWAAAGDLPLAERRNMVFMGTVLTYGRGLAAVAETGMNTELGSIANLMQTTGQEQTPLQKRLDQLGKMLALIAFALVGIIFVMGLLRGEPIRELFLTSISIAVAAIPEGLAAVVTIALALGARRMLRRKALIRKLPAVETLGSVTVICSDKTGTLTENRMTVTVLDVAEHRIDLNEELSSNRWMAVSAPCEDAPLSEEHHNFLLANPAMTVLLAGGALCNDALLECDETSRSRFRIIGDPTEAALIVAAARLGLEKENLEKMFPRVAEIPFDSERKRMTTVNKVEMIEPDGGKVGIVPTLWEQISRLPALSNLQPYLVFTKGAVDGLLSVSDRVWAEDRIEPLSEDWRRRIEAANANLAKNGMRVLGVACRSIDDPQVKLDGHNPEQDLIFIGVFGMIDPARPEVKDAVQTCRGAGIRPMMITGDHPLTARYIAEELGIAAGDRVITGQELDSMSREDLEEAASSVSVYARVSPEHKLKIVEALQNQGQIAAMTGDGVNDAPALRKADIGVAMGITGTDVSKEAADMVLLDDNFATIVSAVEEGRVIYDNIRRFIKYLTSCNSGEVAVMLIGPLLGMPLPLLPLQILWMNLITDGLPALALGVEPPERNVMQRKPYPPAENLFSRGLGRDVIWIGLFRGVLSLIVGFGYWRAGNPDWQTMLFATLTFSQMALALAVRSDRDSLFRIGLLSNRPLLGAIIITVILQFLVIYVPFLQSIFQTKPLPPVELALIILISTLVFWAVELQKWLIRRRTSA